MTAKSAAIAWSSSVVSLGIALVTALPASAQNFNRSPTVVGTKIADGQAYATLAELKHQPIPANNGRMLLAFEGNGNDGIPMWESRDHGSSWQFVKNATDPYDSDPDCEMHWQPHLIEMPRTQHGIAAGTLLLSASTVCGRQAQGRGSPQMHLRLFSSTDFGRSWNYLSTFADANVIGPVWEPYLLILDDGTFIEYYSDETHKDEGYNQMLGHKVSKDGGKTWSAEVYDVAMRGGVERPGMVIIDRLPDGRYVYNYEDVAGPVQNQVHLKFSADGMKWGDPEERGTPVQTASGQYPTNTPNVFWFPIGGPKGVLVVTSRSTGGPGADTAGNVLFWNNNLGVGPWWQAPTPVQKIGNNRAGWTQAMLLKEDGKLLHITSSGSANAQADQRGATGGGGAGGNVILFNAAKVDFDRYEAENAQQRGSVIMRDGSMSNGGKSRVAGQNVGKLTFKVYMPKAGRYTLGVNYAGIGFDTKPRLTLNRKEVAGSVAPAAVDPDKAAVAARDLGTRGNGGHSMFTATANLSEGENTIEVVGSDRPFDMDYLEITSAGR
ncbi:MAG: exo-alpha-sialidase [Steroidobacteraceae bacterium]